MEDCSLLPFSLLSPALTLLSVSLAGVGQGGSGKNQCFNQIFTATFYFFVQIPSCVKMKLVLS